MPGSLHSTFTLDDAALGIDGLKTGLACAAFSLILDGLNLDKDDWASAFRGFRGPS